jgi:hypothetical protein
MRPIYYARRTTLSAFLGKGIISRMLSTEEAQMHPWECVFAKHLLIHSIEVGRLSVFLDNSENMIL